MEKIIFILKKIVSFIFLILICLPLSAQGETTKSEEFWISPGAEMAFYSPVSLSAGGSVTIAYGSGTSIGTKISWLYDNKGQLNVFILDFLLRWYFFGNSANSGLYIQFAGGPAIYLQSEEEISMPVRIGTLTAGLALGWRFLLGNYFYIEPSISGGYPYIFGAGLSAGVRF